MLKLNLPLAGYEELKNPLLSGEACPATSQHLNRRLLPCDVKEEMESIIQC